MKKSLAILLSAMMCLAFVGCNDNNDNENNPPQGQPVDPNQQTIDPNQNDPNQNDPNQNDPNQNDPNQNDPNQNDPNQNDPNQNDPTEYKDKTGQNCTDPLFEGPYIYECVNNKYSLFLTCPEGMVGYAEYSEQDEDYIAGCYNPCSKSDNGKKKRGCMGYSLIFMEASLECMEMADNLYVYNFDPAKLDDETDSVACAGGCHNDKCDVLSDEEGKPCSNDTFKSHCSENVLVYCEDKKVAVEKCDQFPEDNEICAESTDNHGAMCVVNETCQNVNESKYECFSSNESLYAQTCRAAKDGKNYYFDDLEKSVFYECPVCDAKKGTCSK